MLVTLGLISKKAAATAVAVLPLGSTETHGPHLPLETDTIIAEGILDRVKTKAKVIRLPTQKVGASAEHADRPETLSIEPEQLIAEIVSIGEAVATAGV